MFDTSDRQNSGLFADQMERWQASPPGRQFVAREALGVDRLFSGLFGYYVLQIGWTRAFVDSLCHSSVRYPIALEEQFPGLGAGNTVIAQADFLPIATDSVDVVFLPHTLDFAADPHAVLREVDRVLIPEGRVVILAFNPWSLGGAGRLLRHRWGRLPWCDAYRSARQIIDWLSLLGFDVEQQLPISFLPPLRADWLQRFRRLDTLGERWLPFFASAYGVRAVKRVSTLTPLQPRWKSRSRLLTGQAVEPTARGRLSV
jgi:SAM-dependent methyltransferase